ncbi:MAG TPA: GNAT family N-acetyltransferase, partial [Thermoanaerobaculia bacterium]|nr:GNAT family N-acetyltransferase [Thermoanaerobaculia bacterium]
TMMTKIDVQHDEGRKYYAVVDGRESVCEYIPVGERTLNFTHTYVPPELRGKGIAEELVRVALEDALERGYRVIPSCWYVRVYIDRHPRYQPVLAEA